MGQSLRQSHIRILLKFYKISLKKYIIASLLALYHIVALSQPEITAHAWAITDATGKILEGTNTSEIRSIASITKLMTAMIILDSNQSNFTITTSNVLNTKINYTSNVLEYSSYSRDIILQNNIITLENNIKKLIKPVTETVQTNSNFFPPIDITHTYVINSNILGEIRFQNLAKQADALGFPPETPAYKVKIDIDGKLKLKNSM